MTRENGRVRDSVLPPSRALDPSLSSLPHLPSSLPLSSSPSISIFHLRSLPVPANRLTSSRHRLSASASVSLSCSLAPFKRYSLSLPLSLSASASLSLLRPFSLSLSFSVSVSTPALLPLPLSTSVTLSLFAPFCAPSPSPSPFPLRLPHPLPLRSLSRNIGSCASVGERSKAIVFLLIVKMLQGLRHLQLVTYVLTIMMLNLLSYKSSKVSELNFIHKCSKISTSSSTSSPMLMPPPLQCSFLTSCHLKLSGYLSKLPDQPCDFPSKLSKLKLRYSNLMKDPLPLIEKLENLPYIVEIFTLKDWYTLLYIMLCFHAFEIILTSYWLCF